MKKTGIVSFFALVALLAGWGTQMAFADIPGDHPAYLRALSDLRDARWHLNFLSPNEHRDMKETKAIEEIDIAISEIKKAAIDDGKNIDNHVAIDVHLDRKGRYHRTLELLKKVRKDIKENETDVFAHGLRHRALKHVDVAIHIVETMIH